MTTIDPKLEELKQRSHDYSLWFVDTIFGAMASLLMLAGVVAIVTGIAMQRFDAFERGCMLLIAGSTLIVLLAILRTLKDIRFNTRELLKRPREAPETDDTAAESMN